MTTSLFGVITSKYAYLLEMKLGVRNGVLLAVVRPGFFYIVMSFIVHPVISVILFVLAYGSMNF